jgi:UDP-4-amino-4,6-dideoxy-N-acetyl-beta-L-altrosamine N-acetyltransferase
MQIKFTRLAYEDIELVRTWRNSEFVSRYMYRDDQISREQQERWFEKVNADPGCHYWIIEREGEKLGLASITAIDHLNKRCFWAFYLKGEEYAGSGIGAIVEYYVIQYAFETLQMNKICCEVFSFNEKVILLHEKFGFRKEGLYRQHIFKGGRFEDVVALALFKEDWCNLQAKFEKIFKNKIFNYGV